MSFFFFFLTVRTLKAQVFVDYVIYHSSTTALQFRVALGDVININLRLDSEI